MKRYNFFLLGAIILSVCLIFLAYYDYLKDYGKSIHIAFVGPLTGEGAAAGRLMTQAIQLYLKKINQKGGINGKKVILKEFDDQNDSKIAQQQAKQIIDEKEAVAVIGHWYSPASISAGEIYKEYEIPAITPGSTSIKVTEDNPWYFRNIYSAKAPGQFLANYIKYVFLQNDVSIISEKAAYGSYIAQVFEQESYKLGMNVKNHWHYNNHDKNLDNKFEKIVDELKLKGKDAGIILLAVQATEAVRLVKLIKDESIQNPIIGGSSLSEKTFRDGFDNYPVSKEYPGFYTNNIYVATPLIFDTANEKAQQFFKSYQAEYNEAPDWSAAYAYDTVMILVDAIKKAEIQGRRETLAADRKKIRDTLASLTNLYNALEGVTGFNYFDKNRDAQKPVTLGVYKHKHSVSALTQLQIVRNPTEIAHFEQAPLNKQVLKINDKYMYKTNVVYVGLDIIEISDINIKELQFNLEFKLWFRFAGDFNPQDIEFLNAVDRIDIIRQLKKSCQSKKVKDIIYNVCRIKSRFRADFIDKFYAYKQHIVGVKFRHRTLSRNHLIYVTDILGIGLINQKNSVEKRLIENKVLSPTEAWKINRVWFFPNIIKEYSAGDPEYLNKLEGIVEYSQFNAVIQIKKDQLTLRGMIAYQYAKHIMVLSGILFLILTVIGLRKFPKLTWFFQVIFAFLWLLSGEIIFAEWLAENTGLQQMKSIIQIFDILWWLIPAFLCNVATERFIWRRLEEKIGPFPLIIRHFFSLLVYSIAIIGIIVFVYEQQFTSLLAASSVIAMIVGLAIQINISNVFAGIVINMERPFRIGDWIKISKFDEGEVIDINWRATRLRVRNGCILSIPNSIASESAILNFHYPKPVYWLWPTVYVHPKHSPVRVKKILMDALLSANQVLKEPEPFIFMTGLNEWSASYWVAFCAEDYSNKYMILEEVWTRVWFHLNRANIGPAVMRQEIYVFKGGQGMVLPNKSSSKNSKTGTLEPIQEFVPAQEGNLVKQDRLKNPFTIHSH